MSRWRPWYDRPLTAKQLKRIERAVKRVQTVDTPLVRDLLGEPQNIDYRRSSCECPVCMHTAEFLSTQNPPVDLPQP